MNRQQAYIGLIFSMFCMMILPSTILSMHTTDNAPDSLKNRANNLVLYFKNQNYRTTSLEIFLKKRILVNLENNAEYQEELSYFTPINIQNSSNLSPTEKKLSYKFFSQVGHHYSTCNLKQAYENYQKNSFVKNDKSLEKAHKLFEPITFILEDDQEAQYKTVLAILKNYSPSKAEKLLHNKTFFGGFKTIYYWVYTTVSLGLLRFTSEDINTKIEQTQPKNYKENSLLYFSKQLAQECLSLIEQKEHEKDSSDKEETVEITIQ